LDRNLERGIGKQIAYHIESPITGKVLYGLFRILKLLLNNCIEESASWQEV
jgi:hypothetical protein